jgi:hypothetical protein
VNGAMKWRAAAKEAAARVVGQELSDSRGSRRSRWRVNLARRHDNELRHGRPISQRRGFNPWVQPDGMSR